MKPSVLPVSVVWILLGLGACGSPIPAPWDAFGFPTDGMRFFDASPDRFDIFYDAPGTSKDATHGQPDLLGNVKLRARGEAWRNAVVAKGYRVVCEDVIHVGNSDHYAAILEQTGKTLVLQANFNAPTGGPSAEGFVVAAVDARPSALKRGLLGRCQQR